MVKYFLLILNGQFWSLIISYRWTMTLVMKIKCTFFFLSSNSWICYFCFSESFADATDSCHRNQADNRGQPEFTDPGLWPVCSRAPWLADSPGEDAEVTEGHRGRYLRYWTDHHETKGISQRCCVVVSLIPCMLCTFIKKKWKEFDS